MLKTILLMTLCFLAGTLSSEEVFFVGIAGGTCSGKTTFAKKIQQTFKDEIILIDQDAYYKDLSHLSAEEREHANFDHPDAIDFALLREHLLSLKQNFPIQKPIYNFKTHTREIESVRIEPKKIILVEGILVLADPEMRNLFNLKIYVDNQDDVRILRRIERDLTERGRDLTSIRNQYLTTVKPMHSRFVEPTKWFADVIIPTMGDNRASLELVLSTLRVYLTSGREDAQMASNSEAEKFQAKSNDS